MACGMLCLSCFKIRCGAVLFERKNRFGSSLLLLPESSLSVAASHEDCRKPDKDESHAVNTHHNSVSLWRHEQLREMQERKIQMKTRHFTVSKTALVLSRLIFNIWQIALAGMVSTVLAAAKTFDM